MSQSTSTVAETSQPTLGSMPLSNGWRWVRLGDVCSTTSGGTPSRGVKAYYGGSIAWVKSGELNDKEIYSTEETISEEGLANSSAKLFPAGTLLIALYGATVGKLGLLEIDAATNQAVCAIFPTDSVHRDYLFFYLLRERESLLQISFGGAQPNISQDIVRSIKVALPPLPEQKRIAAILNEQMAAVERARAAAEAQLKAAQDLPAAFMRAVFNSPEASEWDRKRLGEVCEIVARQIDPKIPEFGALPHVNGENIESGTCRLKFLRTAAEDNMMSGKYLFEAGDVLYSKLRPYLRKVIVADFSGVCSADMYPIRVNPEFLNPHFTGWLLVSDEFTKYADEESRRARMPKLNREQLFAWEAPLPPLETQESLIESLSEQMVKAESLISKLQDQLDSINKLPAALLWQAFTGKL